MPDFADREVVGSTPARGCCVPTPCAIPSGSVIIIIIIIIIITKLYIAHYRIAPNALIVSVRSSE